MNNPFALPIPVDDVGITEGEWQRTPNGVYRAALTFEERLDDAGTWKAIEVLATLHSTKDGEPAVNGITITNRQHSTRIFTESFQYDETDGEKTLKYGDDGEPLPRERSEKQQAGLVKKLTALAFAVGLIQPSDDGLNLGDLGATTHKELLEAFESASGAEALVKISNRKQHRWDRVKQQRVPIKDNDGNVLIREEIVAFAPLEQ